jgi:hypothetical protein
MYEQLKQTKIKPQIAFLQLLWKGRDVFSLSLKELWDIQKMLFAEGQKFQSFCDKTQFAKYESSAMEVICAVAVFKEFGTKLLIFEEMTAIIQLYNNSDKRLLKLFLN